MRRRQHAEACAEAKNQPRHHESAVHFVLVPLRLTPFIASDLMLGFQTIFFDVDRLLNKSHVLHMLLSDIVFSFVPCLLNGLSNSEIFSIPAHMIVAVGSDYDRLPSEEE